MLERMMLKVQFIQVFAATFIRQIYWCCQWLVNRMIWIKSFVLQVPDTGIFDELPLIASSCLCGNDLFIYPLSIAFAIHINCTHAIMFAQFCGSTRHVYGSCSPCADSNQSHTGTRINHRFLTNDPILCLGHKPRGSSDRKTLNAKCKTKESFCNRQNCSSFVFEFIRLVILIA